MQQRFLLCYDNCIVEIDFEWDWQLTSEQMTVVTEKLEKENLQHNKPLQFSSPCRMEVAAVFLFYIELLILVCSVIFRVSSVSEQMRNWTILRLTANKYYWLVLWFISQ